MRAIKKVFTDAIIDGYSKDVRALGAEHITAQVVSVRSGSGTTAITLQGTIDGVNWHDLVGPTTINSSTSTAFISEASVKGIWRNYRLKMASTAVTISINAWIAAMGHEMTDTKIE